MSSDNEPDSDPTQGAEEELDEVLEKAADLSVEGVEIPLDYPTQGEPFFEYVESAKRLVGKEEWDNEKFRHFWMKNTPLSLDIIFFDENGLFINAILNTKP